MNSEYVQSRIRFEGGDRMGEKQNESVNERIQYPELTYEINSQFILKNLHIPFLIVNEYVNPIHWNDEFLKLAEVQEHELLNKSLEEIGLDNPFIYFCFDLIHESLVTETKQEDELETDDYYLHIKAIPSFSDRIVYLLIEDRSLQRKFDDLLTFHHQLEAVSHIAAGVAHELRNPLSVIKGFLQLGKLTDDFDKYYQTIISEINRMNKIIDDFLSISKKRVERRRQSPTKLMESLNEIMKAECTLHNVKFSMELEETEKLIDVNESMIKQVMLNLLRNSIEAFNKEKTDNAFTVTTSVEEPFYVLTVKDNGVGIPKAILSEIEKPFFTTKDKGTGVGIPLCKRIIEDHGGQFEIYSEEQQGTTVVIRLPIE